MIDAPQSLRSSRSALVDALTGEPVQVDPRADGRWTLSLKAGSGSVLLPRGQ